MTRETSRLKPPIMSKLCVGIDSELLFSYLEQEKDIAFDMTSVDYINMVGLSVEHTPRCLKQTYRLDTKELMQDTHSYQSDHAFGSSRRATFSFLISSRLGLLS